MLQNALDILSYFSYDSLQLLIWRAPFLNSLQYFTGVEDGWTGQVNVGAGGKSKAAQTKDQD